MNVKIEILGEWVKAIGAAGEAVAKLVDGFKNLILLGKEGYEYVAAKRERDRLLDISSRTSHLLAFQSAYVVASLDEYLEQKHPYDESWEFIADSIQKTLLAVKELLSDVQAENGDLVLESAFLTLNQTLAARSLLLRKLVKMPAPSSEEERELLRQASAKYKILILNAEKAVKALNTYIKHKK